MIVGFSDLPITLGILLIMFVLTLLILPCFHIWAKNKRNLGNEKIFNSFCIIMYLVYCSTILIFPIWLRGITNALACNFLIAICQVLQNSIIKLVLYYLETFLQIIFTMKTYAFIRSNVGKAKDTANVLPGISEFIYFLFAPTFLYKHSYPRTNKVRPFVLISLIAELLCASLFFNNMIEDVIDKYHFFGYQHNTPLYLVHKILGTFFSANILIITFSYVCIHLWTNILAEVTRFADKHFYGVSILKISSY